ncbi:MAG: hypothetical protein RQ715_07050 [Methylococcales bacterium]|nr:hypothetical protein [Methylococcales bacterium]
MQKIYGLGVLLGLAGCVGGQVALPVRWHDLGQLQVVAEATDASLAKITLSAPEWLRRNQIWYRPVYRTSTELKAYNNDQWLVGADQLLAHYLSSLRCPKPCQVHIAVQTFEQQFIQPEQAVSVLTVTATHGVANTHVSRRQFSYRETNPSPDAAGALSGFRTAAHRLQADLTAWLAQAR